MSTPCYLPLAILKQALGITVTTSDDALNLKLAGVEQAIETFLGSGGEVLVLTRKPVVSVTSVWEDPGGYYGTVADSFDATDTLLTSGEDYAVDVHGANKAGRLVRIGKSWPAMARRHRGSLADTWGKSRGTVKVTYVAGFQTGSVPADVLDAAVAEAAARWQVRTGSRANPSTGTRTAGPTSPTTSSGTAPAPRSSPRCSRPPCGPTATPHSGGADAP
jgi:hypothetical protein